MFSYNSFRNGNNNFDDENIDIKGEVSSIVPVTPHNLPEFEPKGCPYETGRHCVFDDYEPIFNPAFTPSEDIYMLRRPEHTRPHLSNNPIENKIILFKEMTAYPAYGNTSGSADILYTGNVGEWPFNLPPQSIGNLEGRVATLQIRIILDDHFEVPEDRYSTFISFNKNILFDGRLKLPHGTPKNGIFRNWKLISFRLDNIRRNNIVQIANSSRTGQQDWIGINRIELVF